MSAPHLTNPLIPPPEADEETTQLELMIAGKPYLSFKPYLERLRNRGAAKLQEIESEADQDKRMELWRKFAVIGENVFIVQRFFCEYVSRRGFSQDRGGEIVG